MPSDKALYVYPYTGHYFLATGGNRVTTGSQRFNEYFYKEWDDSLSNLRHDEIKYVLPLELML